MKYTHEYCYFNVVLGSRFENGKNRQEFIANCTDNWYIDIAVDMMSDIEITLKSYFDRKLNVCCLMQLAILAELSPCIDDAIVKIKCTATNKRSDWNITTSYFGFISTVIGEMNTNWVWMHHWMESMGIFSERVTHTTETIIPNSVQILWTAR